MDYNQKAKIGRLLGYICTIVGVLNLLIAATIALKDQTPVDFPLLGSGIGALSLGIIMLKLSWGKQEPKSED